MFIAFQERLKKEEKGFTLIELLVVVIIIGILAAIAIPVFLNQRKRANRAAAQSDLRNAAVEVETFYVDADEYVGPSLSAVAEQNQLLAPAVGTEPARVMHQASKGVQFDSYTPNAAISYCLQATALVAEETWSYDNSRTPQLLPEGC